KALLRSAEVYESIEDAGEYGITVNDYEADFNGIIDRSRNVANKMSKGVQFLMKANKIEVFEGKGVFESSEQIKLVGEDDETLEQIKAKHFIIATGARPHQLPNLEIDGKLIIDSEKAMQLEEQPKKMVVIGAGAIGVEFAYFYHTIGTEVTIVELED